MNDANYPTSAIGLEEIRLIASTEWCEAYGRSGIGGRKENQDSYGGMCSGSSVILTVCDGMGGMNGGQTASRIAATEILQTLAEATVEEIETGSAVSDAIKNANAAIYRRAFNEPPLRGMGTTATVLVITPQAAYLTHIGDSRIYQLRRGKKVFRTFDHSKVFEMVEKKVITEEQARQSSFSNIITQALGIRPHIEVTVEKIPYKKGDRWILCSDGIWNCRPEKEMVEMFNAEQRTDLALKSLTETVNAIGIGEGGGHDNLTAIVVDMKKSSLYQYNYFIRIRNALSGHKGPLTARTER